MRKFFPLIVLLFVSCQSLSDDNVKTTKVVYKKTSNSILTDAVFKDIEIIPINTPDDIVITEDMSLSVLDSDIYIYDNINNKGVYRFNKKGEFLNKISNKGKANNEYTKITDLSLTDKGDIALYSGASGDILYFSKDNKFISNHNLNKIFGKAISYKGENLIYFGYHNPYKCGRVVLTSDKGDFKNEYMESEYNIMPMQEVYPVFYRSGNAIYLRETISNTVYKFSGNTFKPLYEFDFENFNIPSSYYNQKSAPDAFNLILKKGFVSLNLFMENDDYTILKSTIQKPDFSFDIVYGIQTIDKNKWDWYTTPNSVVSEDIFAESIKYLTQDNYVLCLIEPSKLKNLQDKELLKNIEIIDSLNEYSNAVILKCKL